jgi:alkyl sulfatase BDS1-like metallo-beta-lactamase superfamily hydrolase
MSAEAASLGQSRVAEFVKSGQNQTAPIERALGLYESRGVGNSYLFTTPAGDVLVNAGTLADAKRGRQLFDQVSRQPVRYIILTQSHVNQYGGLEVYKTHDTQVIAHRNYPTDRKYADMLSEHYARGSRRIFGQITGPTASMLPTREVPPDILTDERYVFELCNRHFEVIWTPGGETRSAVIVWLPQEKIAVVGNLFGPLFGNQPNLNTLRGDKPRSALEFVESVRRVRALRPELMLTGHEEIRGTDHIESEITRIADSVQWIHDATVRGMNEGLPLRTLMREIRPPPSLALTEEYGKVSWNVRAIWHEYTGWFDPTQGITELYDVPASKVAQAIVDLAGGVEPFAKCALRYLREEQPLEALYLLNLALLVYPNDRRTLEAKRSALEALLAHTGGKNLWESRWIAAELRDLDR